MHVCAYTVYRVSVNVVPWHKSCINTDGPVHENDGHTVCPYRCAGADQPYHGEQAKLWGEQHFNAHVLTLVPPKPHKVAICNHQMGCFVYGEKLSDDFDVLLLFETLVMK